MLDNDSETEGKNEPSSLSPAAPTLQDSPASSEVAIPSKPPQPPQPVRRTSAKKKEEEAPSKLSPMPASVATAPSLKLSTSAGRPPPPKPCRAPPHAGKKNPSPIPVKELLSGPAQFSNAEKGKADCKEIKVSSEEGRARLEQDTTPAKKVASESLPPKKVPPVRRPPAPRKSAAQVSSSSVEADNCSGNNNSEGVEAEKKISLVSANKAGGPPPVKKAPSVKRPPAPRPASQPSSSLASSKADSNGGEGVSADHPVSDNEVVEAQDVPKKAPPVKRPPATRPPAPKTDKKDADQSKVEATSVLSSSDLQAATSETPAETSKMDSEEKEETVKVSEPEGNKNPAAPLPSMRRPPPPSMVRKRKSKHEPATTTATVAATVATTATVKQQDQTSEEEASVAVANTDVIQRRPTPKERSKAPTSPEPPELLINEQLSSSLEQKQKKEEEVTAPKVEESGPDLSEATQELESKENQSPQSPMPVAPAPITKKLSIKKPPPPVSAKNKSRSLTPVATNSMSPRSPQTSPEHLEVSPEPPIFSHEQLSVLMQPSSLQSSTSADIPPPLSSTVPQTSDTIAARDLSTDEASAREQPPSHNTAMTSSSKMHAQVKEVETPNDELDREKTGEKEGRRDTATKQSQPMRPPPSTKSRPPPPRMTERERTEETSKTNVLSSLPTPSIGVRIGKRVGLGFGGLGLGVGVHVPLNPNKLVMKGSPKERTSSGNGASSRQSRTKQLRQSADGTNDGLHILNYSDRSNGSSRGRLEYNFLVKICSISAREVRFVLLHSSALCISCHCSRVAVSLMPLSYCSIFFYLIFYTYPTIVKVVLSW